MLKTRILTALVAAPTALIVFWQGGVLFAAVMLFLALAAWNEYAGMLRNKSLRPVLFAGGASVLALAGIPWIYGLQQLAPLTLVVLCLFLSLTVLCNRFFLLPDAVYNLLGVLYIGIPFAHVIALRLFPEGIGLKFFILAVLGTWACDTFAYIGGTRWGRHKLCPTVSPAKSVEGAVFGLGGCMAVIAATGSVMGISWTDGLLCGVVVGSTCQLGDLVESAIKRFMGVKDSGRFFPGHGGVLDRVDSLLFSVPAAYYYMIFMGVR